MSKPKPDLGLYQAKYWLRDYLRKIPGIRNWSPNALSILAFVPGLAAAAFLLQMMWGWAIVAIVLRMIINTLDGLIAEEYDKKTILGAYLNRVPGEITDILIAFAVGTHHTLPWHFALVILVGWVQIFGILGLTAGGPTQSVGPAGQTDRLALIILACICGLAGGNPWPVFIPLLCALCVVTITLRIYRTIRDLRKPEQA